jgi:hypothetical protein
MELKKFINGTVQIMQILPALLIVRFNESRDRPDLFLRGGPNAHTPHCLAAHLKAARHTTVCVA